MTRGLAVVLLALGACGGEGSQGGPVPPVTVSVGVGAGGGGTGGGDVVSPKRTVITRNPLGNVAASNNLLWDGDFEWMSLFSDQYGWLYNYSFQKPPQLLGAACRSGIKCVLVAGGSTLIGLAVASQGSSLDVSVWADTNDCDSLSVVLASQYGAEPSLSVPGVVDETEGGWCHYSGLSGPRTSAVFLLIENMGSASVTVDDAVIAPHDPDAEMSAGTDADGSRAKSIERARAVVGEASRPRIVPNAARQAYEEHMIRRGMRTRR